MLYRVSIVIILILIGCGFINSVTLKPHPSNKYLYSLESPKVAMNQISTKKIRQNPGIINNLANLDMVIINKTEDLFVDGDSSYVYAKKIKDLNSKVKVLQYLNISDVWSYQKTITDWAQKHPEALLKDDKGQLVYSYRKDYGTKRYMMDPTKSIWQDYYVARMKKITDQGMDGIFVDNLWRSNWQNFNISPVRFRQIQEGWETTLQKARNVIGYNKIIVGNSPPYALYQIRDITMLESRLQPTKKSLDSYFDLSKQANNYRQLNLDTLKYGSYTGSNFYRVTNFYLPAVLLTDNIWGIPNDSPQYFELLNKLGKIGSSLGPAKRRDNLVLERDYSRATVLLNDTDQIKTIQLSPNTYKTIDNTPVEQVTLSPMQGVVLKKIN
ncbi:MAG: putative glycoside hydrolase [Candidatus Gastranaerophilales bacterium]|nr:putative glycoside hydrolase [Candidatus Gastranaerophilales bacterium]